MKSCYQFKNIDMFEHGLMVNNAYQKILKKDSVFLQYMNFDDNGKSNFEKLLQLQYDSTLMRHYHLYHDCGKPYCLTIDEQGRSHYPNHAEISAKIHAQHFSCETANNLIKNDMIFHQSNASQLSACLKLNNDKKMLSSIYLTAWAEIFANSQLFGGFESEGFKIKKKKLISHGKKLFQLLE